MDIPSLDSLQGQVALVTGANRGIGAEVAVGLHGLGAVVYAGVRDPESLRGVQEETDGGIRPVALDVTDDRSMESAITVITQESGRLDLLVNNAAIGDWQGTALHTLAKDQLDEVLATNLRGPMLLTKHALPLLLAQRGSRVVNVSSGMGALTEGMSGSAPAYRVSKTGVNGLTAYLAGEYGPRGLISASVCPGWVRTDMGGPNASRPVEEGAESVLHACRLTEDAPNGRFWRDGKILDW